MSKIYVASDSEVFGPYYSRETALEVAEVMQGATGRSHWLLWPEDAAAYELELKHAAELEPLPEIVERPCSVCWRCGARTLFIKCSGWQVDVDDIFNRFSVFVEDGESLGLYRLMYKGSFDGSMDEAVAQVRRLLELCRHIPDALTMVPWGQLALPDLVEWAELVAEMMERKT